jgi:zinc finger protein 362/384
MLSLVPGSDGNVQFLPAPPQMSTPAAAINQTYITLPITIPPSKPGDQTQTFQIQVLNPNPVPQQPKFQMGQMQIPIHGLQQHGTTVLTVAYSPQDGEIVPNQMPDGAPVTVLAAIQPQDLQLLAQQNGIAAHQHLQNQQHEQAAAAAAAVDEDFRDKIERSRLNIKAEPFWGQNPITLTAPNPLPTDLSEFFQARNIQPYLKLNTENLKKEMYNEALTQLQLSDNNNVISINNNFNADNSNTSTGNDTNDQNFEMETSQTSEINDNEEKVEIDANGKVKKRRKVKKKPPKPKRTKPGQVHIATAIDGTILFCCPECQMAYPEKESLESHLAVHKIERR